MSSKKKAFFDCLVEIETAHTGVMDSLRDCSVKSLAALAVGYDAYLEDSQLSEDEQALVDKIQGIIAQMSALGLGTGDMEKRIKEIKGTPETRAWDAYKAHTSLSTGNDSRATYDLTGKVVMLPFSRLGAFYRFVSISPSEWYLYAMNNGTRQVVCVLKSADIQGLAHGISYNVTSPTLARKIAKVYTTGYNGNEGGKDAVGAAFNAKWEKVNAGGIGSTDELEYGTYAILLKETAKTWLEKAKTGTIPRSKETQVKRAKEKAK